MAEGDAVVARPESAPRLCRAEHNVQERARVSARDGKPIVAVDKLAATHPDVEAVVVCVWGGGGGGRREGACTHVCRVMPPWP